MCKIVENRVNKTKYEIVMNLLALGSISHEDIAKVTGLTLEEVQGLAKEVNL